MSKKEKTLNQPNNSALHKTNVIGSDLLIQFLEECKKAGYKKVAIQVETEEIPDSMSFPFGVYGSVFCCPEKRKNDWPAIWQICEKFDFGGCGNGHQHQIPSYLDKGFFVLEKGNWIKK